MALPELTADGLLPVGDHTLTISELRASYLVTGEGVDAPGWAGAWRAELVDNLEPFVRQLWQVGIERIFVNGSFVTSKPRPEDIDGYWECEVGQFGRILIGLLQAEPSLPWDLTQRPLDHPSGLGKPVMWHRYRVELFPHFTDHPVPTGVRDEHGDDLFFPTLFRRDKATARPKGVIQIIRE